MEMESWVVYVLLKTNTRRWVTHKGSFATQNKTGVWGSFLKFAFLY